MQYEPLTIYLAGKVRKNDWRHVVVDGLREALTDEDGWELPFRGHPPLERSIFGVHHYSGPFPVSDDHGTFHGPSTHGTGLGKQALDKHSTYYDREGIAANCLSEIDRCDLFVAWVDAETAYGTMCEIGYATAKGKAIYLSSPIDLPDHWFAVHMGGNQDGWHHHSDPASAVLAALKTHGMRAINPKLVNPKNKFVYLMEAQEDVYKIGVSLSVSDRAKQLQTANPHPIHIVDYVETRDYVGLEAHLHQVMADKRTNGEWFRLSWADVLRVREIMESWDRQRQNVTTLFATAPSRTTLRDLVRGTVRA